MIGLRRFFPLHMTKRLFLFVTMLLVVSAVIQAVAVQINYFLTEKAERAQTIATVSTILLDSLRLISYHQLLREYHVETASVDSRAAVLKQELQPVFDRTARYRPNVVIGFYAVELDRVVAVAPYDPSRPTSATQVHPDFRSQAVGEPALTRSSQSTWVDFQPVLEAFHPIYDQGQLVGYIWASIRMNDLLWSSFLALSMSFGINVATLCLMLLLLWRVFNTFNRELQRFADAAVSGSLLADESLLPELKPLLHSLREKNRELHREVAERLQAQEQLNSFFNLSRDLLCISTHGYFDYVNPAFEKILGYSREELLGRPIQDFVHVEDWERSMATISAGDTGYLENRFVCKDGTIRSILWSLVKVDESHHAVGRDITELKALQQLRAEAEKEVNRFFNLSFDLMCVANFAGHFLRINPALERALGCSQEEILATPFLEYVYPDDREYVSTTMRSLMADRKSISFEVRYVTAAGRIGTIAWSIITDFESRLIYGVGRDTTEQRQIEQEMTRLDRLNLAGQMAASISHEIRNPMTTVRGFLQLLMGRDEYAKDEEFFRLMIDELDRANGIISEFLSLARNNPIYRRTRDLNRIVSTLIPLIQADSILVGKQVISQLGEIPDLSLDEKEIRQLILNLARNGLEAMGPGGTLTIKSYANDEHVILAVQDEGSGIPTEVMEKLGTPFVTTKEDGTGLGIPVCFRIAHDHGATIHFNSGSDGTTIEVLFPRQGKAQVGFGKNPQV